LMETAREGDVIVCWQLDRIRAFAAVSDRHRRCPGPAWCWPEIADREYRYQHVVRSVPVQYSRCTRPDGTRDHRRAHPCWIGCGGSAWSPGGRPAALDESKIRAAKAMLASGDMSAAEVAQQLGCAASTLYRHLPGGRSALAA
jgi:hypothetical protein